MNSTPPSLAPLSVYERHTNGTYPRSRRPPNTTQNARGGRTREHQSSGVEGQQGIHGASHPQPESRSSIRSRGQTSQRGGRLGPSNNLNNSALALRPTSVAPNSTQSQGENHEGRESQTHTTEGRGPSGGRRGQTENRPRRGSTRPRRGNAANIGNEAAGRPILRAGAAEFIPGEPPSQQQRPRYRLTKPKERTTSIRTEQGLTSRRTETVKGEGIPDQGHLHVHQDTRSKAQDISTRIHEDIEFGQYECVICTSEITRTSRIWSCYTCWTVFHLHCIKKWAENTNSAPDQPPNPDSSSSNPRTWRCPGCNLSKDVKPSQYFCWCFKEIEPRSISGLPPHSCGQTCAKVRESPRCPHPCEKLCHAGPCPPCNYMGPEQPCFCGKEVSTRKCTDIRYQSGWSCGQICGEPLSCGAHYCTQKCHSGLCGICEVRVDARCYCGKEETRILCANKDDPQDSARSYFGENEEEVVENWTGTFQCANTCERPFECRLHSCKKPCHPSTAKSEPCPYSPDKISHCPCGKTSLKEMKGGQRKSCEDPIPNCSKQCSKQLPCGHSCHINCHTGDCAPCTQQIDLKCRCGRNCVSSICHQGVVEAPQCSRMCKTTLNCGRHECGERCCPGEEKAAKRQSNKKKHRPFNSVPLYSVDDGIEAEHICTRICGKPLKCGNHTCQELCHKGPCGSCREAIFTEVSCNCGRTLLQPPLPCGTRPPICRFDCERPTSCGHPKVQHNCHSDDEPCPKCPFLMEKQCLCGKNIMKNQRCWFSDVRCGDICGKKMRCGAHFCRKTCHGSGDCEDARGPCRQACGKPKASCGHPCEETCHSPYPCKEEKPCSHKTIITCPCQANKQEMRCNSTKNGCGNSDKTLKCTEECKRLERKRQLELALNIDPETHTNEHIPYSSETLKLFESLDSNWTNEQEREFRVFASAEDEKRIRFKPMPSNQRAFIHALAEDFGLDSESMDPEPHRHVAIFKTPRFVSAPTKTLRDCVRIRQTQQNAAIAGMRQKQEAKEASKAGNMMHPFNGLLLTDPRFGLTIDELSTEISAVLGPSPQLSFDIQFLARGNVALKACSGIHTERVVDSKLKEIKIPLNRSFNALKYGSLQLARFENFEITRREDDIAVGGTNNNSVTNGWSQVAAKAAAPKRNIVESTIPAKNNFTVLSSGSKVEAAKKKGQDKPKKEKKQKNEKERKESVVEDWEVAEGLMEENEDRESDNSTISTDKFQETSASADATTTGHNDTSNSAQQEEIKNDPQS